MALHSDLKRKRNFYVPGRTTPLVQESRLSPSKSKDDRPAMDAFAANEEALRAMSDISFDPEDARREREERAKARREAAEKVRRDVEALLAARHPDSTPRKDGAGQGGAIGAVFEAEAVSPYFMALDGHEYDPEQDVYPNGMCPICNNARSTELDRAILDGLQKQSRWDALPFPRTVVMTHLALHMVPVYARAGMDILATLGAADHASALSMRPSKFASSVSRVVKGAARKVRNVEWEKMEAAREKVFVLPPEREDTVVLPSVRGAPKGARPKDWWAYDGGRQVGALRPWGEEKVGAVVERKASEAIIFYDEMLETRAMAQRIYDEIMDSDIDALNAEREARAEGKKPVYVERNYGAAINAVKLRKDIATDMARLALIAQKYGDEREGKKPLSPALKQMLDDLGVGAGNAEPAGIFPSPDGNDE